MSNCDQIRDLLALAASGALDRKAEERVTDTLIAEGAAKREHIQITFVDLPPTDYAEGGVTVADQKRVK